MSYHSSDDEGTYRKELGRGHIYILDGSRVTGVTTILNALPKPLAKWGAEKTAELAINEWDRLSQLPVSARLRELEGAPWRDLEFSAAKGTKIHQYAEARARGTTLTLSADVAGYVEACSAFLDDWQVRPVLSERPVFSRQHRYGGSFDLIADLGDNQRWLLDYKTSRSIWGDTGLQLAAYRYADFYLDEDGAEQPMPEVDQCGVIWLRPDGTYELHPYTADRDVHALFLSLKAVSEGQDDIKSYQGPAIPPPVTLAAYSGRESR